MIKIIGPKKVSVHGSNDNFSLCMVARHNKYNKIISKVSKVNILST